jgi:hypothetical protein
MFYEGIGKLLAEAASLLAAGQKGGDAKAQRAQRGITTLLRRLGAVWPGVFDALRDETSVLEVTLASARKVATEHGIEIEREARVTDPVGHYGALQRELDAIVERFHAAGDEAWAQSALRDIRRGFAEAAEVQGRLVDAMLAS